MNKREQARADILFRASHLSNDAQRDINSCCAFCCVLPAKARIILLALVIAALAVLAPIATGAGTAYAYMNEDKTTAVVADFDELKKAVEGSDGYANVEQIIIDPQAAVDFAENENAQVSYGDGAFYIPIEQPIRVSRPVTITNAEGVQVVFARSAKGGNGEFDSRAFAGANEDWPAFFNVINTRGKLTIEGDIVMSGEQVSADFNEADASFSFDVEAKEWSRGNGTGIVDGGYFLHSVSGGEIVVNEGVQITGLTTDSTVKNASPVYLGGGSTYIMNGGAITGNDFGVTAKDVADATTAGAITVEDSKTTANLNEGEISGNVADVAGVFVKEGASLGVTKKFNIDENEIYRVDDAKATEESKGAAPQETTAAPKRSMMMSPKSAPATQTRGTGDTANGTNGIWYADSWAQIKEILYGNNNGNDVKKIIITKDIVATAEIGTLLLRGRTVTIEGPADKEVHIYRDSNGANFPLFTVQNYNNTLTLGENLILSGKTYEPAKTLDDFVVEGESGTAGKGTLTHAGGSLGIEKITIGFSEHYELMNNDAASEFDVSGGYVKATIDNVDNYAKHESWSTLKFFTGTPNEDALQVGYLDDDNNFVKLTKEPANGTKLYILAQGFGYLGLDANNVLCSKDSYDNFFNADNALELTYTKKSKWKIGDTTYTDSAAAQKAVDKYNKDNGLPKANDKTWTSNEISSGANIDEPKAFFVEVKNAGTLNIAGAILEDFVTDGNVKNVAPITVYGKGSDGIGGTKNSSLNMSSGEIRNNTVGYGANEARDSQKSVQELGTLIRDTAPTNTAGGVIFSNGAVGNFKKSAKILNNRADAGALIVTSNAKVTMDDSDRGDNNKYELEFANNIGWHHSGAVLVENGGTFNLKDGSINNNIAWWKGGAVWATEFGTKGLVRWNKYPTSMHNTSKHDKGGNFIMTGGELDSNFANARAGALEVESDGVELYGGTISNNRCKSLGGGIYIEGDSPIYSYTLTIKNGFISGNESVAALKDSDLDKKIENGELKPGEDYNTGGKHRDGDWANYGDKHTGDGGGVWLCAMGGTSIFTSNDDDKVIIDNNTASRHGDSDDGKNNGWGDDFYISHRHGSALVQNMLGEWYNDTGTTKINVNDGGVLRGPMGMENKGKPADEGGGNYAASDATGIKIIGNKGRNGGGIACNGTIIMGSPADVYRYESEFNIEKKWTGLAERAVNIKLYYQYDVNNDKKIDPETEIFELIQQETGEAYAVQLGTNENIVTNPTGNELIYKTASSKAKASIPAKIMHNGTKISLYEIYNQQAEGKINSENTNDFIDVENENDLAGLFTYINNRPDVSLRIKWNILVKEEESNEFIRNTDNDVFTVKANTRAGQEITLVNPDNKEDIDSFTVFFDTVEFGQTLENKPKPWFVKGSYLDENVRIDDAEFKLYHAIKADSTTSNGEKVYKADFSEGKGEVVDGVHYSETDNRYYLDITPPETGTDLYLLFETKAHDGYILPKAPWGIEYKSDGTYKIFRFNNTAATAFEDEYANTTNPLTEDELRELEILCTEINVQIGADHKINNDKAPQIKLTKVKGTINNNVPTLQTDVKVAGAKFKLYASEKRGSYWERLEQVGDILTSASDGTIALPLEVTRTKTYVNYWLEEVSPAPGYVKSNRPWILDVNRNSRQLETVYWPKTDVVIDGNVTKILGGGGNVIDHKPNVFNEPAKLKKVSASDSTRTLSDIEFELYRVYWKGNRVTPEQIKSVNWNTCGDNYDLAAKERIGSNVTIKSGADGTFSLPINEAGVFFLFEKAAATGYERMKAPWIVIVEKDGTITLAANKNPNFVKKGGNGNGENTDTTIVTDNRWWRLMDYEVAEGLVLKNERKPIELIKVDENGSAVTGSSAQFVITAVGEDDSTGWYILEGRNRPQSTLTSASAAKFDGTAKTVSSDAATGKISINDLPKGKYFLFETSAPTGFRRATAPWLIEVTDNENGRSWNIFALKSDYVDKALMWGTGTTPTEQTVAENDQSAYKRWWPDSWFDKTESVRTIANERKYITKVDKDNTTTVLNGAEFTLYYAYTETASNIPAGEKWIRPTRDVAVQTLKSDAKGRIELPSSITKTATEQTDDPDYHGKRHGYLLVETKAPNGYKKSSTPWWITVDSNGNVTVKATTHARRSTLQGYDWWWVSDFTDANGLVKNTPNETTLTKVNGYNHDEKLSGAIFNVYKLTKHKVTANNSFGYDWEYEKGDFIATTEPTGNDGKIVLPSTADGDYLLEEIQAPDGFEISKKPWDVEIKAYDYYGTTRYEVNAYIADAIPGKDGWYEVDASECEGEGIIENIPSVNLKKVDAATVEISEGDEGEEIISTGDTTTKFLSGVKFKLYEANVNGDNWSKKSDTAVHVSDTNSEGIVVTNDNGVLELGNLKPDTNYLLYEHEAKEGYILPSAPWRIKIGSDGKIEKLWVPADENGSEYTDTVHKTYLTNSKTYNLPSAGGMGTYWFMIIGAMMMAFAATMIFVRRRGLIT